MKLKITLLPLAFASIAACNEPEKKSMEVVQTKGIYVASYDAAFANESDREGLPQEVVIAWSRGAAAAACRDDFDKEAYIARLVEKYPTATTTSHELNGFEYHELQIKQDDDFAQLSASMRQLSL